MTGEFVTVYDQAGQMLGTLERASNITYNLAHNDLWTASFSLPNTDPKNAHCQAHNYVRVPDGNRDLGLYRIIGMPTGEETAQGGVKTYSLEHVMATLLDDVLFGYHELGGWGTTTAQVMQYILDRQTTVRWALHECDFTHQFEYKFENTSLLTALLSLGEVLITEYTWIFDTSTTPWRVSFKRADTKAGCGIHYMRNMVGVEKSMDATMLATRLYLLGYGEGVNQLTVREVNDGLPYIDADTMGTWGVKCDVFADTRIEDAETLLARGQAMQEKLKNPYISYAASAIDLAGMTGHSWDTYMPGKLVRVQDSEHGLDFTARIVDISKRNVRGRPGDIRITIANAERDAARSINTLANRVGINELYSQGATNLVSESFRDNASASYPARMRVYVDRQTVRINRMLLSWRLEPFRAYSTAAAAGGGGVRASSATSDSSSLTTTSPLGNTDTSGTFNVVGTVNTGAVVAGTTAHYHPLSGVMSHSHSMGHVHNISHNHRVTVNVDIPDHTHPITYGIYEGSRATSLTIRVDGNTIPAGQVTASGLDIVPWMAKDADGKITRGTWHTVELVPNTLTRIEANLAIRVFIQSVGGGDF